MRNFKEIKVWEKAHQFTLEVYRLTRVFPQEEAFELRRQIRRSAASVPTNIAEGCGRRGNAEFAHFLEIAMGSAKEADYQILLAKDLGYLNPDAFRTLSGKIEEIQKMLTAFIHAVKPHRSKKLASQRE